MERLLFKWHFYTLNGGSKLGPQDGPTEQNADFASFDVFGALPSFVTTLGTVNQQQNGVVGTDAILISGGFASPSAAITDSSIGANGATAAQVQKAQDESGLNVNGAGVKVGLLSDSFNNLGGAAQDEADGALPAASSIQVLKDLSSGGTDEGRAMMQIVHDIAPGASLAFYTAFNSEQDFANGILSLATDGCKVICDDVSYFDEPFFQNGIIAQAIQTVEAEGVVYVTAAGNNASDGYQSTWIPISGTFDGINLSNAESFGGSLVQTITIGANSSYDVPLLLEWNQPYGGVTSNLEILAFKNGKLVATATNSSSGEPTNPWVGLDLVAGATYQIAIENISGPNPGLIKEIAEGNGLPVTISGANIGTVYGHAMTPGTITVGAVSTAATPAFGVSPAQSESFSSSGAGTELLFNNNGSPLSVPDLLSPVIISGVDNINTTLPGGLSDFYGTSAATASIAGVVALILQANPNLTPAQVDQILQESALAMANPAVSGAGLVQTNVAVADALDTTPPTEVVPSILSGNENAAISLSGVSVSDSPNTGDTLTTVLTVSSGTITVATPGGAVVSNNGTTSATLVGTATAINAALASTSYSGKLNYYGFDSLSATTTDVIGNTSGAMSVGITITDTAIISETVPASLAGNENTAISLGGVSVSDNPNSGDTLATLLTVSNGTVMVGMPGGTVVSNNNTSSVRLSGTASAIDAALATTTYVPKLNYNGADSLAVTTTDAGGNTSGAKSAPIIVTSNLPAAVTWANGVSGAWQVASDWNPATVPGAENNVFITAIGTYTVTDPQTTTVYSLATATNATLDITSGTFTITNGTGTGANAGIIKVEQGATLDTLTSTVTNTGVLINNGTLALNHTTITGGTLTNAGTGDVTGGTISTLNGVSVTNTGGTMTTSTPLALDGNGFANKATSTTSASVTLTTTKTNDVIILDIVQNGTAVSSVSDVAGLNWHQRAVAGTAGQTIYEYYAIAANALSADVITVNFAGAASYADLNAFGVSGANTSSPFDSNVSVPASPAASTGSITTSNANDLIIAGYRFGSNAAPAAGSGWTTLNASGGYYLSEYQIVSATQAGLVATASTGDENGGIIDAIVQAAVSPPTTGGMLTVDAGSTLDLTNTTINGGTLSNSGIVDVTGGSVSTLNSVVITDTSAILMVDAGSTLALNHTTITGGTLNNAGTVDMNGGSTSTLNSIAVTDTSAILMVEAGSTLALNHTTITGGTLTNAGTGDVTGGTISTLNGVSVTNTGGTMTTSTPLALDGNGFANKATSTTSASVTLTTTKTNDVIILDIVQNGTAVSSVSDVAGLNWHQRAVAGTAGQTIYEYYAIAANALSADVITVNFAGAASYADLNAFGVSGANTSSPFDSNVSVPASPAASTGSITTSNANDLIIAGYRFGSNAAPAAGSGWTTLNASGGYYLSEYQIVSATQAGLVATASTGDENGGIIDAIQAGSATVSASSMVKVEAGSTLALNHTTITGGTLTNAGTGDVTGGTISTLNGVSVTNTGGTMTTSTPLALDGNGFANKATSTTSASVTLTTTKTNDVIILDIVQNGTAVSSVSDVAGLNWHQRAVAGTAGQTIYEYYAIAANALSADVITVNFAGAASYADLNAFGVSGANTSSPFDSNVSVPASPAASTGSITTSNANDLIIAGYRFGSNAAPAAGSGWTTLNASGGYYLSEYQIVSATQAGLVATASTGDENGGIIDAIVQAAVSPPTTGGMLTVDAGSTLDLTNTTINGGTLSNSGTVDSTGTSALNGVAVTNSGILEATSGALNVSGQVTNIGNLLANGGTVDIAGAVTGSGTATISGTNSVLEFGAASAENTTFSAAIASMLKLDNPSSFTGTVAGLATGDSIDLTNFLFSGGPTIAGVTGTGAVGTTTNVTVHDQGGAQSVTLQLLNQLGSVFAVDPTAYSLVADNNTPNHGTLFHLAAHG